MTRVLVAIAFGLLAAGVMRRLHLRWTWSVAVLVLVVLTRGVLAGSTSLVGLAALCAAWRGRRAHVHDLRAGADLARIAAGLRGPLHALRWLINGARLHLIARRPLGFIRGERLIVGARSPLGGFIRGERLIVGRAEAGRLVSIGLGGVRGGRHTLVIGATGAGKSVTQTWIAAHAIASGMGALVLDPKGEPHMRAQLAHAAHHAGRPFLEWTPQGPCAYNPLAHGSPSAIADKALAGERFTEPHYLRQAQRYLGHAVRVLHGAGHTVSLRLLAEHLQPERLEQLARTLPREDAAATCEYLDALGARQRADLAGVRDRLAILAESDVGRWLEPSGEVPAFDVLAGARDRAIVYFSLRADERPLLAHMLAAAIVQDLIATVAALQGRSIPTIAVLDEFSALGAEHIARLFARARSAGLSLVLGTQELSDLRLPGHALLLEQVLANVSCVIAHRQIVPESCELLAHLAGSRGAWRASHSTGGGWTRARTREPLIDAHELAGLPAGWAAVIELGERGSAHIARMLAPPPVGA